jgi:hypothetical protein
MTLSFTTPRRFIPAHKERLMTHEKKAHERRKKPRSGHGHADDGVEKPAVTDPNANPSGQIFKPKNPYEPSKPHKS